MKVKEEVGSRAGEGDLEIVSVKLVGSEKKAAFNDVWESSDEETR